MLQKQFTWVHLVLPRQFTWLRRQWHRHQWWPQLRRCIWREWSQPPRHNHSQHRWFQFHLHYRQQFHPLQFSWMPHQGLVKTKFNFEIQMDNFLSRCLLKWEVNCILFQKLKAPNISFILDNIISVEWMWFFYQFWPNQQNYPSKILFVWAFLRKNHGKRKHWRKTNYTIFRRRL